MSYEYQLYLLELFETSPVFHFNGLEEFQVLFWTTGIIRIYFALCHCYNIYIVLGTFEVILLNVICDHSVELRQNVSVYRTAKLSGPGTQDTCGTFDLEVIVFHIILRSFGALSLTMCL